MKYCATQFQERGYIAVVTAIILSAILSGLVFESSTRVFLAHSSEFAQSDKDESYYLADSCVQAAFREFLNDSTYLPHEESILVDSNVPTRSCIVDALSLNGNSVRVTAHASIDKSYTFLEVIAQTTNGTAPLSITSLKEESSIPP